MNLAEQLDKLRILREQGALSEEEFTRAKARLLDGDAGVSAPPKDVGPTPKSMLHALHRSDKDRWLAGVCSGLAETTEMPAWSWRVIFVLSALLHGLGLLVYVLLWIFLPLQRTPVPSLPAPNV